MASDGRTPRDRRGGSTIEPPEGETPPESLQDVGTPAESAGSAGPDEAAPVAAAAEAAPIARKKVEEMTDLALRGVGELVKTQRVALSRAGVDLDTLLIHPREGR